MKMVPFLLLILASVVLVSSTAKAQTAPVLNFTFPTPVTNTFTANTSVVINTSVSTLIQPVGNCTLTWNGANESMTENFIDVLDKFCTKTKSVNDCSSNSFRVSAVNVIGESGRTESRTVNSTCTPVIVPVVHHLTVEEAEEEGLLDEDAGEEELVFGMGLALLGTVILVAWGARA